MKYFENRKIKCMKNKRIILQMNILSFFYIYILQYIGNALMHNLKMIKVCLLTHLRKTRTFS